MSKDRDSPWASRPVSVDMLKQFLTRQVTEAAVRGLGIETDRSTLSGAGDVVVVPAFRVARGQQEAFRDLACDYESAARFLADYAPVWESPAVDAAPLMDMKKVN